jgi:hypothetical protein
MRATRRRARTPDPLGSGRAVEEVLNSLRTSLPEIIPTSNKALRAMLQAVRSLYARPSTDSKRGRPGRFPREDLLRVDAQLRSILSCETSISVRSFIGQYLPILDFPRDVREALERGEVNLFEAHQLARLTGKRIGSTDAEARKQRRKLLEAHLLVQASGAGLRDRVKEFLGETPEQSTTSTEVMAVVKADELLEIDPLDSTHLFYEELRRIGKTIREVAPEDLTQEDLDKLMPVLDLLGSVLSQIGKRIQRTRPELKKLEL